MLEREAAFYSSKKAEFHEKYPNKWLVISGDSLFGVYDKISDAGKEALKNFKAGEFMIHRPADDDKVIRISSPRVRSNPNEPKKQKPYPTINITKGELIKIPYVN